MQGTKPMLVEMELTSRCDLRCAHCYRRNSRRGPDLDTLSLVAMGRSLAEAGCVSVTLSGGEPTLRMDWPVVAEGLNGVGLEVNMVTNGLAVDAAAARAAGVSTVLLSLDGGQRVHDRIRGRRGAYRAVMHSAQRLSAAGVRLGFLTTVIRHNVDELEELSTVVRQMGACVWQVWLGIPQDSSGLWLPRCRWGDLAWTVKELQKECACLVAGDTLRHLGGAGSFRCQSGTTVMGIRSDGQIGGCLAAGTGAGGGRMCAGLAAAPAAQEGVAHGDAALAASVALAAALACSSCGPKPVPQTMEETSASTAVDVPADLPADVGPEMPLVGHVDSCTGGCVCVSENPAAKEPLEPPACMCVSHMMCTATTGMCIRSAKSAPC